MIFGVQSPEFLLEPGGEALTYIFEFAVVIEDKYKDDMIVQKSVFNGVTRYILKGTHHQFKIRVHLFKEGDIDAQTLRLENFKYLLGKTGYLKRHADGEFINKKDNTAQALYVVSQVEDDYFETPDFKDTVIITFNSTEYVAVVSGVPLVPEGSVIILDDMSMGSCRYYAFAAFTGSIITYAQ